MADNKGYVADKEKTKRNSAYRENMIEVDDNLENQLHKAAKFNADFVVNTEDEKPEKPEKTPFKEMTCVEKTKFVAILLLQLIIMLASLYFFMCSLSLLSSGFILVGGRGAGEVLGADSIIAHPLCGLMLGVVITAFLNSSSTTSSICVIMVASNVLEVKIAIPIIMGTNIGASITSTIVAVMHAGNRDEFRDAFTAATLQDMFNWLCVIILLPIELLTGYLERLTAAIVNSASPGEAGTEIKFISVITEPFTKLIVQIDKTAMDKVIANEPGSEKLPLMQYWCQTRSELVNDTGIENATAGYDYSSTIYNSLSTAMAATAAPTPPPTILVGITQCKYLFHGTSLSETAVGAIILGISLVILIVTLIVMVKVLQALLAGTMNKVIHKAINANFPGKAACLTGYLAMIVGMVVTILIQSSVVTTATLTSLVGLGMITTDRVFPMILGANIGTTSTAIFAAFATSSTKFKASLQIALCHLFFNITGIIIWYPLPFMRKVPMGLAKFLGHTTARYGWFAIFYLIMMFIIFPLCLFLISLPGLPVLLGVGIPILVLIIAIGVINLIQNHCPGCLPGFLKTWDFLPEPLRSLAPMDRVISKMIDKCTCCCSCCQNLKGYQEPEGTVTKTDIEDIELIPVVVTKTDENKNQNLSSQAAAKELEADVPVRTITQSGVLQTSL